MFLTYCIPKLGLATLKNLQSLYLLDQVNSSTSTFIYFQTLCFRECVLVLAVLSYSLLQFSQIRALDWKPKLCPETNKLNFGMLNLTIQEVTALRLTESVCNDRVDR